MDPLNNVTIADLLDVSRAAVSRFRNGSRIPRMETQLRIASAIGWAVEAQATAHAAGQWAQGFNDALERHYGATV